MRYLKKMELCLPSPFCNFFKANSQNLFIESSDVDKRTTHLCNEVYTPSPKGKKKRGVIKFSLRLNGQKYGDTLHNILSIP